MTELELNLIQQAISQRHSPKTTLHIVAGLGLDMSTESPILSGETETVFWPSMIEESDLKPLTFRYRVKQGWGLKGDRRRANKK